MNPQFEYETDRPIGCGLNGENPLGQSHARWHEPSLSYLPLGIALYLVWPHTATQTHFKRGYFLDPGQVYMHY